MKIGYVRVSTDDQNPDMQVAALERAGAEKIYKDHGLSGATTKRPALLRCLKVLDDGDTLIVWKLDRLGRSLHDVVIMLVQRQVPGFVDDNYFSLPLPRGECYRSLCFVTTFTGVLPDDRYAVSWVGDR